MFWPRNLSYFKKQLIKHSSHFSGKTHLLKIFNIQKSSKSTTKQWDNLKNYQKTKIKNYNPYFINKETEEHETIKPIVKDLSPVSSQEICVYKKTGEKILKK